jgi:hypothetical protein
VNSGRMKMAKTTGYKGYADKNKADRPLMRCITMPTQIRYDAG